jgi:hypothetical protein
MLGFHNKRPFVLTFASFSFALPQRDSIKEDPFCSGHVFNLEATEATSKKNFSSKLQL